jgi:16S rRNA (guanine527-N7)-methyltransferase
MKGSNAATELADAAFAIAAAHGVDAEVRQLGTGIVEPPTTVVAITRAPAPARSRGGRRAR